LRGQAPDLTDALTALLRHEPIRWSSLDVTPIEFLQECADHEITSLVARCLSEIDPSNEWPEEIRSSVSATAYADAAFELARGLEIRSVLSALRADAIEPILLKGAALAYTVYEYPACRPRADTDLMIRQTDIPQIEQVMARLGYSRPLQCDGKLLFSQFELHRTDDLGITHAFDFHWRISTQPVFAEVLAYEELARVAERIQHLGENARGPAPLHSLLLACIHPAMHHRNAERLIWMYDIHLLASRLGPIDFDRFAEMAVERRVAAICRQQLALVHRRFGTFVPAGVMTRLSARQAVETSEDYLHPGRRWHNELASSLRALPDSRDRRRLLSEVLFPSPRYMLNSYGFTPSSPASAVLPLLYVHRAVRGAWNILRGHK
jgi:hypothetical protein